MEKVRALLTELKADEYVRFKYGKAIEAALKGLESHSALDQRELEAQVLALLELVRGKKGGPAAPRSKSKAIKKAPEPAHP